MISPVPCNKSVPSNLSVSQSKTIDSQNNRRDILLRDKIKFQDSILATVFVYIDSRKTNKRKVNTRNFASD